MTDTTKLLLEMSACSGVSGVESGIAKYIVEKMAELAPNTTCCTNVLGSVICTISPSKQDGIHLMLDSHMDEIGLIVTYIEDDGFLRVTNVGGIDRKVLIGTCFTLHTKTGDIPAVVCSVPPHLQKGDSKEIPPIEEMALDIGMNGEQTKAVVHLGDRATFASAPAVLANGCVSAKALDDRACCAAMMICAQKLENTKLDIGLSLVFATMEETGSQGAKTSAQSLLPTHAIALDVSFAHSPGCDEKQCGKMGGGPMIGIAPILNNELTDCLITLAKEKEIGYQLEVMGGSTGTDANAIAVAGCGVKTGLISIPLRYMHTPTETVDPKDVETTADLLFAYITQLNSKAKEGK